MQKLPLKTISILESCGT